MSRRGKITGMGEDVDDILLRSFSSGQGCVVLSCEIGVGVEVGSQWAWIGTAEV